MKKFISILMIICMITVVFASCQNTNDEQQEQLAPEGMKLVNADTNTFSLYVPESWIVDMSTGTISAYVSALDSSNISFAAFALDDVTVTLDSYWEKYEADFKDTFGTMKYIDESGKESDTPAPQKTTLSGFEANKYVYTARVTGEMYKFMQVTCIVNNYIYILTYTAVVDNYDSHLTDVDNIINNFAFN